MFQFIETPLFRRMSERFLDDDEYGKLQHELNEHPESGAVVPGSGGVRKMRWATEGRGKRGGLRVIYYLRRKRDEIWMLTVYGKNVRENIPAHVLKQMKEAIEDAKEN
jgi:mRNA-degrading endonuclease RelE of RelBE toxin-antitoxin system